MSEFEKVIFLFFLLGGYTVLQAGKALATPNGRKNASSGISLLMRILKR